MSTLVPDSPLSQVILNGVVTNPCVVIRGGLVRFQAASFQNPPEPLDD